MLLDDLEQSALKEAIRFDLQISDPANAQVRTTPLAVFICPASAFPFCTACTSDPQSPMASTAMTTSSGPGAGSATSPTVVPVSLSTYRTARTGCPASHERCYLVSTQSRI